MNCRRAFTMVELMLVIAIIALLLTIMTPTLREVMETVRKEQCRANLSQMGFVLSAYAGSNDGYYPPAYIPADTSLGAVPYAMQFELGADGEHGASAGNQTPGTYTALKAYGLNEDIVQCPANPVCWINPPTLPNGTAKPGHWRNVVVTSYCWAYGLNPVPTGIGTPSTVTQSPMMMHDNPKWVLAADLAEDNEAADKASPALYNHTSERKLDGGNHLYVNGSVQWRDRNAHLTPVGGGDPAANFKGGASGNATYYHGQTWSWWWAAYKIDE